MKRVVRKTVLCVLTSLLLFPAAGFADKKRIYIAPDDHTDYMWTADEETYKEAILSMLDYYIALNSLTGEEEYPYQSKWNCDGSWWLYLYEHNRSAEQFDKLLRQIREGRITVPLNTLESVMGVAPLEAILRDMYYAGKMQRKYGLEFPIAMNMEDQVLPWGLSSLWAGAGAKYSWRGVCSCVTQVKNLDKRENELYWYTGPDGRKVLMKWYSVNPEMIAKPNVFRYNLGKYLEADNVPNAIKDLKELLSDSARYPYDAAAAFGMGGDNLKTLRNDFLKAAKEYSDEEYQVYISNGLDFFRYIDERYGDKLPGESVSYGSTEWGTAMASLAEVSASVKRSVEKLRSAEMMYTMAAMVDNGFGEELGELREQAWLACGMFFEHDWTADSPDVTRKQRADWERATAGKISRYVDTLYNLSLGRLEETIGNGNDDRTFFVLNPLGWDRTDVCDVALPCAGTAGRGGFIVRDLEGGKTLETQTVIRDGVEYIRFIAPDIPAFGYRLFSLEETDVPNPGKGTFVSGEDFIENEFYRITVNRQGTITGLVDKKSGRDMCSVIDALAMNDLGKAKRSKAVRGTLRLVDAGPVSVTVEAESYFPLKHTTGITLYSGIDRIEIDNSISENFGNNLTSYTFSFNMENPWIRTEEAGAVVDVRQKRDGGDYADDICRLDWVAMNHFADISNGECGVTLSNRDALFMKTGHSNVDALDVHTPQIKVLVGGKVTPWLGVDFQDGDSCFHNSFAVRCYSGGFDAGDSMRFSLEHQNPLIAGAAKGDFYNGTSSSVIRLKGDGVIPWCLKPSEDGIDNGVVVRAWNVGGEDSGCEFSSGSFGIGSASLSTHIETPVKEIKVRDGGFKWTFGHDSIETFILKGGIGRK